MSLPVVFRAEAQADLTDIFTSYEVTRAGLGVRFYDRVRSRLLLVADHPHLFAVVYRQVRSIKVPKFPYVIYYRAHNSRIEILAVVHGRRNSTAWKSRID